MGFSIAIDGPAGAGKSTIAKRVAKRFGSIYIDTGAMYRTMALYYMEKGIDCTDIPSVIAEFPYIDIKLKHVDEVQHVILNGRDVTDLIRTQTVGENASKVSAIPEVRSRLVALQREIAEEINVVMDGRDIASVVLPYAQLKIYLTASVEVRAVRRHAELIEKGQDVDLATIEKQIAERDYRDMHRDASPLVKVSDAIEIDSSDMTIEEVTDKIITLAEQAMQK